MKVVLSIDPIRFPLTGIGRYTYELARGLQQAKLERLRFLRRSRLQSTLPALDDGGPTAGMPAWKRWAQKSPPAVFLFRALHSALQGRALRGLEDHVFHGPNFYLPPFPGRSVVTIHDLSVYLWPHTHPPERVRYMHAEIERSLQRAVALITNTQYTRIEVARFFGWPLERVHAVPLASAAEFRPRAHEDLRTELRSLGVAPGEYTLFTGTVEPRKNIGVLLDAYSRLPAASRARWPLVIAGYRGWASEELHDRFDVAQREGWLKYLGFVPDRSFPVLMAGARLFAYPSLYEGFGLPVLEAMASGVPVVCSNAATLPEVAGSAAAFHSPEDVDSLSKLLRAGLEDDAWRARAVEAGLQQAAKFSWNRCTRETLKVYEMALKA